MTNRANDENSVKELAGPQTIDSFWMPGERKTVVKGSDQKLTGRGTQSFTELAGPQTQSNRHRHCHCRFLRFSRFHHGGLFHFEGPFSISKCFPFGCTEPSEAVKRTEFPTYIPFRETNRPPLDVCDRLSRRCIPMDPVCLWASVLRTILPRQSSSTIDSNAFSTSAGSRRPHSLL
jgi:hypothetical protein